MRSCGGLCLSWRCWRYGGVFLTSCSGDDGDGNEGGNLATTNREPLDDGTVTGRVATTAPSTAGAITLYKNNESQGNKNTVAEALKAISTTGTDNWTIELAPGIYEATGLNYKGTANITIAGKGNAQYGTDVLIVGWNRLYWR